MEKTCKKDLKTHIRYPVLLFLLIVGCLQMVGDLFGLSNIKGFALALQTSPAAKVFTAQNGFETYSSNFYIDWKDKNGHAQTLHITPAVYYHGIKGPYNRRNAYGAALSYSPVLYQNPQSRAMLDSVLHYTFCQSHVPAELGIDPAQASGVYAVRLEPRQALPLHHSWKLHYDIVCP